MQALFGCHCFFQHVQADRAHEFTVQASRAHGYLRVVGYRILRYAMELVQRQFPSFVETDLLG